LGEKEEGYPPKKKKKKKQRGTRWRREEGLLLLGGKGLPKVSSSSHRERGSPLMWGRGGDYFGERGEKRERRSAVICPK